jgi:hypothetical protein
MTPPDYREQAIPKDVWDAISRYTNEATSGMPLHEQLEARKERIRLTLASWASRIAEEERERCAKVASGSRSARAIATTRWATSKQRR